MSGGDREGDVGRQGVPRPRSRDVRVPTRAPDSRPDRDPDEEGCETPGARAAPPGPTPVPSPPLSIESGQ